MKSKKLNGECEKQRRKKYEEERRKRLSYVRF